MASDITPDEIQSMKKYLHDHPLPADFDGDEGVLDETLSPDEFEARCIWHILKNLGELPT